MSGGQWMVVLIVAIVMIGKLMSRGMRQEDHRISTAQPAEPAEAARLRDEVRTLKERLAVLERIATDDRPARDLDREIEALRDARRPSRDERS